MSDMHDFPEETQPSEPGIMVSNKIYNVLKPLTSTILPALAALYIGLAQIWNWGYQVEVGATVTVVNTFLGALLLLSSRTYNNSEAKFDGSVEVVHGDEGSKVMLNLPEDPNMLLGKDEVILKVNR